MSINRFWTFSKVRSLYLRLSNINIKYSSLALNTFTDTEVNCLEYCLQLFVVTIYHSRITTNIIHKCDKHYTKDGRRLVTTNKIARWIL